MELFEEIVFYLFFLDAIGANIASWTGLGEKLNRKYLLFSRWFPITKGWTAFYLILVLWIGCALIRLGIIL